MKQLFTLLLLLITTSLSAQRWLQAAGGSGRDELYGLTVSNQYLFTTGTYGNNASFDQINLASIGNGDIFISKQSLEGEYVWVKRAGGLGIDKGTCITALVDQTIAVAGTFTNTIQFYPFSSQCQGIQDAFITKMNENGDFLWLQTINGSGWKNISSITSDFAGDLYVCGEFKGEMILNNQTYISTLNPETNEASKDVFLIKISSSGTILWTKQGKAKYDDQALSITTAPNGDCYFSGRFSDTLSFESNYANFNYNAGFILKINGNGNEVWFKKITGSLVSPNALKFKNNSLFIGGDFGNQLIIHGNPSNQTIGEYSRNCFLTRMNPDGSVLWTNSWGSENSISLSSIDLDEFENIYAGGTFRCGLTGFRTSSSDRLWETLGYRDIFLAQFSFETGNRIWARHYGGLAEDLLKSIVVLDSNDVILGGSSASGMTIPRPENNLILHQANKSLQLTPPIYYNYGVCSNENNYYGDTTYYHHLATNAFGEKDIMVCRPVDLSRPILDLYYQFECGNTDNYPFYINSNSDNKPQFPGADSTFQCGSGQYYLSIPYYEYPGFKREYNYTWNLAPGINLNNISLNQGGWLVVTKSPIDGCAVSTDSLYISDYNSVPTATFTSSDVYLQNIIVPEFNYYPITYGFYLEPDTVHITGLPVLIDSDAYWYNYIEEYSIPNDTFPGNELIQINPLDTFHFAQKSLNNPCTTDKELRLYPFLDYAVDNLGNYLDSLNPGIFFHSTEFDSNVSLINDTIIGCNGGLFTVILADSNLWEDSIHHNIFGLIRWQKSGPVLFDEPAGNSGNSIYTTLNFNQGFTITNSGLVTLTAEILRPPNNEVYKTITRQFYVKKIAISANLIVDLPPTELCLADTVYFSGSNIDSLFLFSSALNNDNYLNIDVNTPIPVWQEGSYIIMGKNYDPQYGCSALDFNFFNLSYKDILPITMNPSSGVICPGQEVILSSTLGNNRYWIGPTGDTLSTEYSINISEPGLYRYIQDDEDGCRLSSETVEIKMNSLPFLQAEKAVLCPNETMELFIYSDPSTTFTWLAPLSGSSISNSISQPGMYEAITQSCGITDTISISILLNSPSAQINAPDGINFCPGEEVNLFANTGIYEYLWYPSFENGSSISVLNEGSIILEVSDYYGCSDKDTITLVENTAPDAPIVIQEFPVCNGDSAYLSINTTQSIEWFDFPNGSIIDTSSQRVIVTSNNQIEYVRFAQQIGNCASLLTPFEIQFKPNIQYPIISSNSPVCIGDSLIINSTSGIGIQSYLWDFEGIPISSNQLVSIPHSTLENQGNYSLTLIADSLHCSTETDSINIQILPLPEIQILTSSSNYCEGESLELTTNNSSTNQIWNYPNGSEFTSQTLAINNLSLSDSGLYQVKITNLECIGYDSIYISISPKPETPFLDLINGNCLEDTLILKASGVETQPGDLFVWQNNLGQNFETTSPELIVNPYMIHAEFYSTFLARNNCFSETDTVFLSPLINFNYNYFDSLNYCPGNEIVLNPNITPINQMNNFWWISPQGDTLGTSLSINLKPNSSENGDYKLIVIDTFNCQHIYSINLSSNDCNQFAIPNSFTPNGDGHNDNWNWGFDLAINLTVALFNRWGSNVTNLTGNTIHWNGENANGEALPSGTYYYVIKWLLNGQVNETKGYVEIKR